MDNSDFLETKSPTEHPLEMLRQIQSDLDDIEDAYFYTGRALENKYQKKFQPFYKMRSKIVYYGLKPMIKSSEIPPQGVPNLWLSALRSNESVSPLIQKHDEDALTYLRDIKWCRIQVTKDMYPHPQATDGFKLKFVFGPNPYFKNSVLSKTYCLCDEFTDFIEKVIGTPIEWFPGKCLTSKAPMISKSSIGMTRTTLDSFFNFFSPLEIPEDDVLGDLKDVESVLSLLLPDYCAGRAIRDIIIPHAVLWFIEEHSKNESGDMIGDTTNSQENENVKVEKLSPTVLQNVELLKKIQSEHELLEENFFDARRRLEAKYLELCQPLFKKRYEIVNGIKPADQGEIKAGKDKGVPNFWLTALKADIVVARVVKKHDEEILKYLKDIRCIVVTRGFKLEFEFSQNTYFKNTLLTVSYFIVDECCPAVSLEETIGTEIEWLVERCWTNAESFFNIFSRSLLGCEDSEKVEAWRLMMELDTAVGVSIRKNVIPHAVALFENLSGIEEFGDDYENLSGIEEFGDDYKSDH